MKKDKDFKEKLTDEWFNSAAESHLEGWHDRYKERNSKKDVAFDLRMNHDPSLEIEDAEEELGRKLIDDEREFLVKKFNRTVVKMFYRKNFRD